jgi:hypothetical protein
MHAEDAVVDEGSHGETVEAVDEEFPEFDVVAAFACVGEELHSS